ncbi:hypothetical protein CPSG_04534 [Coccidioides posadasii str. Silveira]|uniref:Uncharacterized protein n=1 Tax=Coccidioides posadasii (strain RMSCC 757 / Silveira) TaxID=443226 RepID=E9D4J5_COCPS|nr:hypothetical protein CPSG_04534 [Coccidioides posadasii str. Silveira]
MPEVASQLPLRGWRRLRRFCAISRRPNDAAEIYKNPTSLPQTTTHFFILFLPRPIPSLAPTRTAPSSYRDDAVLPGSRPLFTARTAVQSTATPSLHRRRTQSRRLDHCSHAVMVFATSSDRRLPSQWPISRPAFPLTSLMFFYSCPFFSRLLCPLSFPEPAIQIPARAWASRICFPSRMTPITGIFWEAGAMSPPARYHHGPPEE